MKWGHFCRAYNLMIQNDICGVRIDTDIDTHIQTHIVTDKHTYTHMHTDRDTYRHTHMHARMHTDTDTHSTVSTIFWVLCGGNGYGYKHAALLKHLRTSHTMCTHTYIIPHHPYPICSNLTGS